jgi:hypothetical protein
VFQKICTIGYIFCFSGKSTEYFRSSIAFEKELKAVVRRQVLRRKDGDRKSSQRSDEKLSYFTFAELEADDVICFTN